MLLVGYHVLPLRILCDDEESIRDVEESPEADEMVYSTVQCAQKTTGPLELTMRSHKHKFTMDNDMTWGNNYEYHIPKPRPLKPPWPHQQSTKTNIYSVTSKRTVTFTFKMTFDWSHDTLNFPQWTDVSSLSKYESPYFWTKNTQEQPLLVPNQSGALTISHDACISYMSPRVNSTSIFEHLTEPCSMKRRVTTQTRGSKRTPKRQKLARGPSIDDTSITSLKGVNKENGTSPFPDFSVNTERNKHDESLFPCPFYLQDPIKYGTRAHKSCSGLGRTINRLKEHLRRRHRSESRTCGRCLKSFNDAAELSRHLQNTNPCEKQDPIQSGIELIDDIQASQLRKRMRGQSDLDKWKEIYRIIFRLDSSAVIPSPSIKSVDASLEDFRDFLNAEIGSSKDEGIRSDIQAGLRLLERYKKYKDATSFVSKNQASLATESPGCPNGPHNLVDFSLIPESDRMKNSVLGSAADSTFLDHIEYSNECDPQLAGDFGSAYGEWLV